MGFVAQLFEYKARDLSKPANKPGTKAAVARVLRANKHLKQAVDALKKTMSPQDALLEVIQQNPALKIALALELLKHK